MRRRPRRHRNGSGVRSAALVLVVLVVVVATAVPAQSVLSATLDRSSSADVVVDDEAVVGLSLADEVHTGSTERLLDATNNYTDTLSVTVALASNDTDLGDLVLGGTTEGDTATFDLQPDAGQRVSLDVPCDGSLAGRTVTVTVKVSGPGVDGEVVREHTTVTLRCTRSYVTYVGEDNQKIQAVDSSGSITYFDTPTLPHGIGPYRADLDGDGRLELPYRSGGDLKFIDATNETQTVAVGPMDRGIYGVGDVDGDGTPAVVYANESDNNYLYRVEYGSAPVRIGSGIPGQSVAGVTDFDGDGVQDIVYTDSDATVQYLDGGANWNVVDTGVPLPSQQSIGIPRDFDGDGRMRVPIYNKDGQVTLVDATGDTTVLNTAYTDGAKKQSLGSIDWNGDGRPEVVTIHRKKNSYLYYMTLDGTNQLMVAVVVHQNEVGVL